VGTEDDLITRAESKKSLKALRLTRAHLEHLALTIPEMEQWGYITQVPEGLGGERPSEVGNPMKCERCAQVFAVRHPAEPEECLFHWGKPYTRTVNGLSLISLACTAV